MRNDAVSGKAGFEPKPDECPVCGEITAESPICWTFHLAIHDRGRTDRGLRDERRDFHSYIGIVERRQRFASANSGIRYIADSVAAA